MLQRRLGLAPGALPVARPPPYTGTCIFVRRLLRAGGPSPFPRAFPLMQIHAITVVKNEADIVGDTLRRALDWADAIYVLDNGSTDGTWEILRTLADESPAVFLAGRDVGRFHDGIRAQIYHQFEARSRPGDWWCRLDADEIYIDDPRTFLHRVPPRYGLVWGSSFTYYFTDRDLARYETDPSRYAASVPIDERIRYYHNNWSELRFVRETPDLFWPDERDWPIRTQGPYPRRIRVKNFVYRSPEQIRRRLDDRYEAIAASAELGASCFQHEQPANWVDVQLGRAPRVIEDDPAPSPPSWRSRIMPAAELHYDAGDGTYVEAPPGTLPPLPPTSRPVVYAARQLWHNLRRRVLPHG
mgnify:CR=1 FL=1